MQFPSSRDEEGRGRLEANEGVAIQFSHLPPPPSSTPTASHALEIHHCPPQGRTDASAGVMGGLNVVHTCQPGLAAGHVYSAPEDCFVLNSSLPSLFAVDDHGSNLCATTIKQPRGYLRNVI